MVARENVAVSEAQSDLRWMLGQLREQAVMAALAALYVAGILILVAAPRATTMAQGVLTGFLSLIVGAAVWLARRNHSVSAWLMVGGCVLVVLLTAAVERVPAAVVLLILPAGLAVLAVGIAGGLVTALLCSVLLLFLPATSLPVGGDLRLVTGLAVWAVVGMISLALRLLLTALEWSWASYRESHGLLERARDTHVQLKQALADLTDANLQLTRLNRLTQALRQAAEDARHASETFVANVSHELRTPLNMIIGFSEMILDAPTAYGCNLPASLLADLEIVLRNSQHLSGLIDDVLDLSQIEAGQVALTRERVVLAEVVDAALVAVRPLFESKGLYLEAEIDPDLTAFCDRTRIREVILNLLSNAGRFTERGGARLRAWREGGDAVVSVTDSGPGIADEDKDKVFRPFQQLDGSLRRRYGGSGLGLSISRSFVEMHGGKMGFESELSVGTTFYFRLPIEPPTPIVGPPTRWLSAEWHYEERTRRPLPAALAVRPRFVLVETGTSLRRLLARYWDEVELVPAGSLEEGLHELARVPGQGLLVNDTRVGEVLQRLSASDLPYGTPIMVCSVPGLAEAAHALGALQYLVKPVAREDLLGALDDLSLVGKTVLIVDDEPDAQRLFWRMLSTSGRGYRVLTAGNGREALSILRGDQPDVVLLDLVMPDMDGFQLLATMRNDPALCAIPTVVISAQDPTGQPIITNTLTVTRRGGLSAPQLLACLQGLTQILSTGGPSRGPEPPAAPSDSPACV